MSFLKNLHYKGKHLYLKEKFLKYISKKEKFKNLYYKGKLEKRKCAEYCFTQEKRFAVRRRKN